MLVSSVGYFDNRKNISSKSVTIKNQPSNSFTNDGENRVLTEDISAPGFIKTLIQMIKGFCKMDEEQKKCSKSLTLIG